MPHDPYALQQYGEEDRTNQGLSFSAVKTAIFANPYQHIWGGDEEPPLPYRIPSFLELLRGALPLIKPKLFFWKAAARAVDSRATLRWGPDRMGFQRLIHPNGVCLTGHWKIDEETEYSGYFRKGSEALVIARYSAPILAKRGVGRGQAMAGKLFPTTDPEQITPAVANFFTGDDIAGTRKKYLDEIELTNAPDVTPGNARNATWVLIICFVVFTLADRESTIRQLHEIAELGKGEGEDTRAPLCMRLTLADGHRRIEGEDLDLRDEVMGMIYDRGDLSPKRKLIFNIDVTDEFEDQGLLAKKRIFKNWRRIGTLTFNEATISYNGDHVLHFTHPGWRADRNKPETAFRRTSLS